MTSKQYSAPSVRQLAAVVDGMAGQVSEGRVRQLQMVVGMFDRMPERTLTPRRAKGTATDLFDPSVLSTFWSMASAGNLRARAQDVGTPLPLATRRVVLDCLRLLAGQVVPAMEVWLPVVPQPAPRATTEPGQEAALYRFLVGMAGRQLLGHDGQHRQVHADYRTRLLAMTSVVLDTRSRAGELARMRVQDLDDELGWVRVVRHPQNGAHLDPVVVTLPLTSETRAALRRWLPVRKRLVYPLEGARDALWVSVASSNRGEPPGLPLREQSLGGSYARGVRWLNGVMAGREGWSPLPDRLEGLRRAWVPPEEMRVREGRAAAAEALRPPPRPRGPVPGPVQHGREYTYNVLECRCDECTEAASFARKVRRAEQQLRRAGG